MNNFDLPSESDAVSLSQLVAVTVRGWRIVAVTVCVAILAAVIYLHFTPSIYTAELDVSPADTGGGVSKQLGSGGLGDLAAIAGISLPAGSGGTQFELYVEGLQSYAVADALSKRTDLMKILFRKEWNENSQQWVNHVGIGGTIKNGIKFLLGIPVAPWQPPNGARVKQFLEQEVKIDQTPKKLLVTISFQNEDPEFAVYFLKTLHETTDNLLRQKQLQRATSYANYLNNKLATVTVTDYRAALSQSLIEQEKTKMAASSNVPFAAQPLGNPGVPEKPSSPQGVLILVGATALGFFLGIGLCLAVASGWTRARWLLRLAG